MSQLKYVPDAARDTKDDNGDIIKATFKGHLLMNVPGYFEMMDIKEDLGMAHELDEDNNTKLPEKVKLIPMIKQCAKLAQKHCESVHLEHKGDGSKYTNFDELLEDPKCHGIVNEVAMKFVGGFGELGKS